MKSQDLVQNRSVWRNGWTSALLQSIRGPLRLFSENSVRCGKVYGMRHSLQTLSWFR